MLHMQNSAAGRDAALPPRLLLLRALGIFMPGLPGWCWYITAIGVPIPISKLEAVFWQLLTGRSGSVSRHCDKRSSVKL
jgi:hypothetical protein